MGKRAVNHITAAEFAAYLNCPTKSILLTRPEEPFDTFFTEVQQNISRSYKAKIRTISSIEFLTLGRSYGDRTTTTFVDSETAFYSIDTSRTIEIGDVTKSPKLDEDFVPILYSPWDKLQQSDYLVVSFCALAIGRTTGLIPPIGKIIFGDAEQVKTVKVIDFVAKARQVVEAIAKKRRKEEPPPVVMNKHCPVCDFRSRCRDVAIKQEDLGLLGAMTEKERAKCADKGISTITQLSYGYRPRRRKRVKSTASPAKVPLRHDHKLKAVAIKKSQIHVVGSPVLSLLDGTPVFIDVEGMPGRDFYYLIGLRYQKQGKAVERSFWADGPEDEFRIWRKCVDTLREIDNPRLIHYGAYESRFLRLMIERWNTAKEDAEFVDQIIDGSTNLISTIYGKIYFPTYENGLKDIARWLGFEWKWPQASGGGAILLRRCWELTRDQQLRQQLIAYNIEDCRAVELVADAIKRVCGNDEQNSATKFKPVNVSSLEVGFQRTFGKFSSVLPEFEKINAAAYWDYQRSKVYVRTNKVIRKTIRKATAGCRPVAVEKGVTVDDRPKLCPAARQRFGSPCAHPR